MRKYGDETNVVMYHRNGKNWMYKWLEVKTNKIEGGGIGFFVCRDFEMGEIITNYLGLEIESDIDSIYSITNGSIYMNCKLLVEVSFFLGAQVVNDSNWGKKGGYIRSAYNG